ncbi:MAG: heat-inducible transcriptional repressor HrcA [Anaerolineae bacterium]|jgi:heat-inducible transcriptional repressor
MTMSNPPDNPNAAQLPQLTPRQREVLRVLVREYVDTATPVASGTLRRVGDLGVSSATLRSELALLEELGYLEQPHTSAGRVPSVRGYRYFVEQLMEQQDLPAPERRTIMHQFHQIRLNLDQWMELTAAVLAQASQAASLVTPPHATRAQFKHLELISTHDTLCLMILVLQDGSVHQEMLSVTPELDQETLSSASNQLNALLTGLSADEIVARPSPELATLSGWKQQVLERVIDLMHVAEQQAVNQIYRDGLVNIFGEPEFQDVARTMQVVEMIERQQLLQRILRRTLDTNGVQIIIGGEGPYDELYDVSLVLSPYGIPNRASGVLGVLGPTRMHYGRAISAVRYVAQMLNSLVAEVYG